MRAQPTHPPSLPYLGVFMWRTKSSYTSEGWYRSMAAGALSSWPRPLLRCSASVFRTLATPRRFPLPRACVRFFPPRQGAGEAEISFRSEGDRRLGWGLRASRSRWFKLSAGSGTVGFCSGLGCSGLGWWPLRLCVCVCDAGVGMAGIVSVSVRLQWARETGDFTQSLPRIGGSLGSGVKRRSQARTGQAELSMVGLL